MFRHPPTRWPTLATSVSGATSNRVCHKPQEVGPCPVSGDAPSCRLSQGPGLSICGSDGDDCTCSAGYAGPVPGLCSTPSSGGRAPGTMPCPGSPVHVSSLSIVDSPERSLRHDGGSPFQADPLVISSDPVNLGILVSLGISVSRSPSSASPAHSRPPHGPIHLRMGGGWHSVDSKGCVVKRSVFSP